MSVVLPSSDEIRAIVREELDSKLSKIIAESAKIQSPQPDNLDDGFLSQSEVSQLLQVSKLTIIKWQKQGLLKVHRIGRRVLYKRSEVLSSLSQRVKK
ncbi:MAG: helix-turn-helix domain-containing protein [Candidatus Kapabacteria bacterium]|nr:helix-turn-helix domain-containing protein [Candidatus Kapabacteria bacterium]